METHPLTAKNWLIVALIAVALGLWFVFPFLGVIAISALMAFVFHGTYDALLKKMRAGAAASVTFLFSLAVVVVPITIIAVFTVLQLGNLATNLSAAVASDFTSLPTAVQDFVSWFNSLLAPFVGTDQALSGQSVVEFLKNTLPAILRSITAFITGFIGGIPLAIVLLTMYIFLFYEFLVFGKKIISSVIALSPFQPEVTRLYLARVGLMANAMAKGQVVIAFIVAALSAATLGVFLNMWEYFILMTVVFTVFNLVPLGSGLIVYPIIIVSMLLGNFWPGIAALIVFSLISNLDSFLRPRFIPPSITLTNGLTMLAAFAGIALYGLLGVVYGPIIMIVIVTSIQMYLDYYQEVPRWKSKANKPKA